jgi:hypothetical protein
MRILGLRKLYTDAPTLTDEVMVTHQGVIIGHYVPTGVSPTKLAGAPFDRLEKAVEQAKAPPAPKPLPKTPPPPGDRFGKTYPAPKPSSKK